MNEPQWIKAKSCSGGTCVEVAITDDAVYVRNSTDPTRVLEYTHPEWTAFVDGVNAGEFRFGEDA